MSANEMRDDIHALVEQLPEDHLERIRMFLERLKSDSAIIELGSSVNDYNAELDAALERYRGGIFHSQESVMKSVNDCIQKHRRVD